MPPKPKGIFTPPADRKLGAGKAMEAESHARKVMFATFYSANPQSAMEAYHAAGYTAVNPSTARAAIGRLLKDEVVLHVIHNQALQPAIATREERQMWWTKLMRGRVPGATVAEALRASELLGKSQGDFVQRVEITGRADMLQTVRGLLGIKDPPPAQSPGNN